MSRRCYLQEPGGDLLDIDDDPNEPLQVYLGGLVLEEGGGNVKAMLLIGIPTGNDSSRKAEISEDLQHVDEQDTVIDKNDDEHVTLAQVGF